MSTKGAQKDVRLVSPAVRLRNNTNALDRHWLAILRRLIDSGSLGLRPTLSRVQKQRHIDVAAAAITNTLRQ